MALEVTKVFITGHNGFIGKALTKLLEKDPKLEVLTFEGDLLEEKKIADFFLAHRPQVVIHLAGLFGFNLTELLRNNVLTTQQLLNLSNTYSVNKFIFSSTGAVYNCVSNSIKQELDSLNPNTPYGISKKIAEELIIFNQEYENPKMHYSILRFPNIFGPDQKKGIFHSFRSEIEKHGQIIVHGDGSQKRDFLHITDACEAILLALKYPLSDVFNISSPISKTILEIVKFFKEKYTFNVNHVEQRDKLVYLLLNYKKAKKLLGYEAKVTKLVF